jgi:uncharacterized protein (TIGR02246 family)
MSQLPGLTVEERLEQLEADAARQQVALDEVEARAAIRRLMADYALGTDRHDAERFLAIWTEDAVYDLGEVFGTATGREAIHETLKGLWEWAADIHHWVTDVTVTFTSPDSAFGDAHVISFVKHADGGAETLVACTYDNVYERRAGEWLMARCKLDVHWWKQLPFETLAQR